ncbi:amino acid ABC transporter substrate-binding protein [Actinotalea ferrariae]|uniref:ABC transporter substrate-binding protein n=1 Tax=Actinotalea ferrariae TaxID=1386098 RepID=UPI001C8C9783|nr:ABC transporter substrate-binding protein [Actinotalea ferrariae]MBX9244193.1 amino acid ABC transporter substrate-binding protein [Actinotalea ferrariae]
MLRRTQATVVTALAALALAGCSSTATDDVATAAPDEVQLVEEGVLTMCANPPYEPFTYEEDGEVVGFEVDIVREVATDLGVDLEIVSTPFEGLESGQDLETRKCDVVASGITITDEREERLDFAEPHFDADQGLLVPAGSNLTSIEDLEGFTVGVQQATTGEEWALEQDLGTVQLEDLGLQVEALRAGQVDAVVNDIAVLGSYVDDELEIGAQFPTGEQYGIGVRTGNTALLAAVDATLERIRNDGTYDALYEQHIGTAPTA